MEIIGFTLVGLALYFVSDKVLFLIELKLGRTLENRSLVFFAIITVLALPTFNLIQYMALQADTEVSKTLPNKDKIPDVSE